MKKIYLFDVSSMYFRAFYAIRPLSNSKGMPTNALYGFLSMTVKYLKQFKPDYMAFCFDLKGPTFRKEMFPEYKANRSEMPEDLVPQVPYVKRITDALGIPAFSKESFEADDLIGSFCEFGRQNGLEVVIVSGDKDFAQLIGPHVSMYDSMKDKTYDEAGVLEKWGVKTEQFQDYLAIVGDASDNIPGVKGVGPKGAQKLLGEFSGLSEIYESLDKIKNPGMVKKLTEAKEMAFLSKELVKIVTDIRLVENIDELALKEVGEDDLVALLEELDFQSFKRNILNLIRTGDSENTSSDTVKKTAVKETSSQEIEIVPEVDNSVAVKETADFKLQEVDAKELDKLLQDGQEVWTICNERGVVLSPAGDEKVIYKISDDIEKVGKVLSTKNLKWSGFDLKSVWKELKIEISKNKKKTALNQTVVWDSMLAAYVVKAGKSDGFEKTYTEYTGNTVSELPTFEELLKCEWELKTELEKQLKEKEGEKVFHELELPLIPVLYSMESEGVLLDSKALGLQSEVLGDRIKEVEQLIYTESGETFNIASPKQLSKILFEKMEIEPIKKTKTGFSTNSDVLEKLAVDHKIADYLMEYRELTKLKSTYIDALPLLVDKETERLHTSFFQAHTATGRLSSQNPNLQNIPIRTEMGRKVRSAFTVPKGHKLIAIDYSQIELRILAHVTGDKALCKAFQKDQDIHAATASEIYNVDINEVTSEQRRSAKAVNFGIAYGQGVFGLSESLGVDRSEASEIIKQYFLKFPKVADYMVEVVEQGKDNGYVETIFGRRRYIEELSSGNGRLRKFGERAAINAPIQGAASDIVKKAMIDLSHIEVGKMLLQVHDEILFEVESDKVDEVIAKSKEIMENVVKLDVPLKVNSAVGSNWEEAHA